MSAPRWYDDRLDAARSIARLDIFYLIGCQKSGTTWVQRLIDAHPRACCGAEAHIGDLLAGVVRGAFTAYNERQGRRDLPAHRVVLENDDLRATLRLLGDTILARYAGSRIGDLLVVGDKTPEHALAIPLLSELYPDARFIHVVRDGRDAAVSGWSHLGRQGRADAFQSFADYAVYVAQHHWVPYIRAARAAAATRPDRHFELKYEALHAHPEEEIQRLLAFLGLDAGPEMVEQCRDAASFRVSSGGRERGDEDGTSFFRKGSVGDWRDAFDADATRRFESAAGELLHELGYETVAQPSPIA